MIFAIVGDGGFAINSNIRQFMSLVNTPEFANIIIKSFANEGLAYFYTCKAYSSRIKQNWGYRPALPTLDLLMSYGGIYYNPNFIPRKNIVNWQHYFGVIFETGFTVTDNFASVVELLETYARYECMVLESPDLLRSLEDFSDLYENQRMSMAAYVQEPLILPEKNKLIQLPCTEV